MKIEKNKKRKVSKVNYFVDEFNRLVIKNEKEKIIANGKWLIENNRLIYVITEKKAFSKTNKIIFSGHWSLDRDHNLVFTLDDKKQFKNQKLTLKVELIDTKDDALIFLLKSRISADTEKISLFQLKGRWTQDNYNRIQFLVEKEKNFYDVLTFKCAWDVYNNSLLYTYEKIDLKTKKKITKTLSFKGFWNIQDKNRISYILNLEKKSVFSFLVSFEKPYIKGEEENIRYSVGIGYGKDFKQKNFVLEGKWKISKSLGIYFEIKYSDDKIYNIIFGATVKPIDSKQIIFELKNKEGKDLGIAISFSYAFLKKTANWFMKFIKEDREFEIKAGVSILW